MWFARGELRAFDGPAGAAGQALLDLTREPSITVDVRQRRRCPRCPDSVLMRHFFSAKRAVAVDECPTCAGIWLDAGELHRIRTEYGSEAERRQAARLCLEEILVGDRMNRMRQQLDAQFPYDTTRSRVLSSLLVAVYVVVGLRLGGAAGAIQRLLACVVPWACVCFPDALGSYVRPFGTTRPSPRSFVWFFGWLVLLLPVIRLLILLAEGV